MTTTVFDPVGYKRTTREQWQTAAQAWHEWGPFIEAWLGEATELMLDVTQIRTGSRVLDVAAGAGGQTLAAARRVGTTGRVLATDIAPNLLAFVDHEAEAAGLATVSTRVMDGEQLAVEPGYFDAVISRLGLIYFPDRQRALTGIRRALRPGGRIGAIVYSTPEANEFFSIPVSVIRGRAKLPPPLPGQPGPFSLGTPGALESAFVDAGFAEVNVRMVTAPQSAGELFDGVTVQVPAGRQVSHPGGVPVGGPADPWDQPGPQPRSLVVVGVLPGPPGRAGVLLRWCAVDFLAASWPCDFKF